MSHQNQSPLDFEPVRQSIVDWMLEGQFNTAIVAKLKEQFNLRTNEASIRRFRRRHHIQIPGTVRTGATTVQGDVAKASTTPKQFVRRADEPPVLDDPDAMLRERGLDPEEWYIDDGITVNQWDGPHENGNVVTYYQAKFRAKRKRPELSLHAPRSDGWKRPRRVRRHKRDSQLVVVCGDYQAPFYDENLHALFCQFLNDEQPERGVNLGDLMDFPDLSRHKDDPENIANANECMQSAYDILRGHADASPQTEWDLLLGNHDIRLRDYEIANAPRTYGLRVVDAPDQRGYIAHNLAHILRLDELGINLVDPHGSYEDAQITLSKNLAVRHGWILRQGSGATALKTLETTGHSVIVGHTHRQATVYHTFHEIDGTPRQLLAAETGCMCRIDPRGHLDRKGRRFPSYTTNPNWQQGFLTVEIYEDGKFKVDLATYVNKTLLWRDRRYE